MNQKKSFLLIGNSRWHWALKKESTWHFIDTSPKKNLLENYGESLQHWAAVGSIPATHLLEPSKKLKLEDVPLLNKPVWLGIDRALAAWGAHKLKDKTNRHGLLVIDAGTILSLTKITDKGEFIGGQLIPGWSLQLSAMCNRAVHLVEPKVRNIPEEMFPTSTDEAMVKGSFNSLIGTILIAYKADKEVPIFLCGGDGHLIANELQKRKIKVNHQPNLVLEAMINL